MTHVTFYSLQPDDAEGQSLTCHLAANLYSDKQRASIWCYDKAQAEAIDEKLWQAPAERFIPHNLVGEGPQGGAPIEICWEETAIRKRQTVVVLTSSILPEPTQFQHIIDFVPLEENAKQAARERYKYYQQQGCQMQFAKTPLAAS